tara:strand:+ start:83 stop:631 length:549 start_codon:yes stop_codon:yes gene_type:complete
MYKSIALIAMVSAKHHQHNLVQLMEDPDCTTSQIDGRCSLGHYADEGKAPYKVDYFVPNWGQDEDVKSALSFAQEAESDLGVTWTPVDTSKDPAPKRNYFVPNFGVDHDIADNASSLSASEGALKHKLTIPKTTKAKDLGVPPVHKAPWADKLDADVVTTLKNEKAASASLGQKWVVEWPAA